ncbi:hypothetical protein Anas_07789 [Armadillidium nasatum]|uniref:Uncharacterized protein n=1 Tax=Armadillidium nasatum TaxID=96803 RepID=A0A5N5SUP9_9CRUS|nr:hypothetical protein Anas_07789 [Armadillidium nasatum]
MRIMNNGNVFSLSTGCELPHTTGTKYRKFANFKNLNRSPKRTSLTNPCAKNKYDSFNKNHLKSINISNNGHGSSNHANSFSKNNNNSYTRKFTMKSVLVRDKTTKLKTSSSKMHNVKVYLIKERPFKSPNLPSRDGFCLIKESKQPKYYATPSSMYIGNKLDRKFSSFCDKNSSNFVQFKNKMNKSNSWKKIPRGTDNNSHKIYKSVSDNTDSCTFVKIKSRFSSDKVCNKLTTNLCKGSPRDKKIVRVVNKSSCSSSWKPDIQFHNLNSNISQSKNSMNIKHIYKKFKFATPSPSENIDKPGRDLVNKKHHEVTSNSLNTFKTKKPENQTIRSGNKDLTVQNLKPGDAVELNCHVKKNSVSLETGNESFTDTNINKKRKLCSTEKQMEKPRKKIASEISNLYPVVFSMSTRSKRKPDCEEKNDSLKDKHIKSPSTNSKNNCYSESKGKNYSLKEKSLEKINPNSKKDCSIKSKEKNDYVEVKQLEMVNTNNQINFHSKPKEIFVKHSDNDNNNINLTSEENETLTSKSGNCNLTSFVNDHIQKSKFKNYKGKPPSKVEFDMNNSAVIVHRNPLLEKFVSENLSSTESNSSYLFPISSPLTDVVTIKEEPVNFDDYEVYGMDNSNSNLQQWVIDAFGRVIVKEEVADLEFNELSFFDDSEESPDCNFET